MLRNRKGFTLLELSVAVLILGIVIGLLYTYQSRGQKVYNKSFAATSLQSNARSALEQMMLTIKQASRDHVFTDSGFNFSVPLPPDAYVNQPYIYFAKPNFGSGTREKTAGARSYDYFVYYISKPNFEFRDNFDYKLAEKYGTRAKIKSLVFRNQSRIYTEDPDRIWPFLPPILELGVDQLPEDALEEEEKEVLTREEVREIQVLFRDNTDLLERKGTSFLSNAKLDDLLPTFSLYQSSFAFGFSEGNSKLFKIRVNLVDELTKTSVEFESAVTPRN